jgi:raffinose/stachyose/melibiose transport system substrate-binding protein
LASAKYPGGAQSLSITSFSKNKKEAADFLRFLHTSERADALFKETNGAGLMADRSFDTGLVTNPTIKDLLDNYVNASKVTPSVVGYLPAFVHDEGLLKSLQLLLGGQLNADGAIKTMDDKSAEWRNQSPEEVKIFEKLKP